MTISELCQRAELSEPARQLAEPDMALRSYIETLARGGFLREAVTAFAHLFPKRDAVAWGLESLRGVGAVAAMPLAGAVFEVIDQWLAEPNDARRRAALQVAEPAGMGTPASCLALAVFLSGGSIAPAQAPVAPEAPPHACGKAVAGALAMAIALEPGNAVELQRSFVDRGFRFAKDLKMWEEKS
jgi:hypothetical protein